MTQDTTHTLSNLHAVLKQLYSIREELKQGPLKIRAKKVAVNNKEQLLEQKREELVNLRKAADEKSLQLKTNEAKIAELNTKLNMASSNRDFSVLKSQIEADEMANSVLEDEILESLDKVDEQQQNISTTEAELQKFQEALKQTTTEIESKASQLQEQAIAVENELVTAEKIIPANLKDLYRRLIKSHGAEALAIVENKICTACNTTLSPQEVVNLNIGELLLCRECGRIIYLNQA